jgi:hypothetical protein
LSLWEGYRRRPSLVKEMNIIKLAKLNIIFIAAAMAVGGLLALFPAAPALAQEPEGTCTPITSTTFYLNNFVDSGYYEGGTPVENDVSLHYVDRALGPSDNISATLRGYSSHWVYWSYSLASTVSGTVSIDTEVYQNYRIDNVGMSVHTNTNASVFDPGWTSVSTDWDWDASYTGQVGSIRFHNYVDPLGNGYSYFDSSDIVVTGCVYTTTLYTCPTVDDYHFTSEITDTWLLSGGASIADSILSLPPGESASQDLSLSINSGYNAVISVTGAITPASLDVYLAGLQNVVLTGTGLYTVPFTTGTAFTQSYQIFNNPESSGNVDLGYTCLYPTTITDTAIVCLAPTNGEFNTADDWDWHYDARWNESGLNAYLPYNDTVTDTGKSLVVSSGTYSLPTLITNTWLIMAFESMALGQSGVVATRVGENWQEFDVNSSLYRFEADIGSQAGLTLTTVSFANAGAPEGEFAAVDDLTVDNVCIYVSDTPPNIPSPTNPWMSPFSFGFNFTCADVPALLAGYGIDVYTPAAVYQSGVITWTEENWVPWLAGAVWNNAGAPVSCFLVEFMRLTTGIAEQFINNYTNVINWNYETLTAGVPWFQEGVFFIGGTPGVWFSWYASSLRGVFYSGGLNTIASTNWTRSGFIETQNTMSNNTLDVGAETGRVISQIVDLLLGLWNTSIVPWMNFTAAAANTTSLDESTGEGLFDLFGWIVGAVSGLLNLFWSILSWLAGLFTMAADIPVEMYHSVQDGISSEAYIIDTMCAGSNFWCYFWAGVYLVNQTVSQTIVYPIVIAGLILVTLGVIWRNLSAMFTIEIG